MESSGLHHLDILNARPGQSSGQPEPNRFDAHPAPYTPLPSYISLKPSPPPPGTPTTAVQRHHFRFHPDMLILSPRRSRRIRQCSVTPWKYSAGRARGAYRRRAQQPAGLVSNMCLLHVFATHSFPKFKHAPQAQKLSPNILADGI